MQRCVATNGSAHGLRIAASGASRPFDIPALHARCPSAPSARHGCQLRHGPARRARNALERHGTTTMTSRTKAPLSREMLTRMNAYWRAANYLSVGQIYLYDNPLLRKPLTPEHIKPRLLGHWGTTPGLNFIYVHLNRAHRAARPEHDPSRRSWARRPGHRRQHLSRGHLQRAVSRGRTRRARHEAAVHAVLVSRRHSQPLRAGDAGLDQRRRRAGLQPGARLWRRVRQPRPARGLRHRRRRGRNRRAGRRAGTRTSSSTRNAMARCCRSCTSTATRSPTRRSWRGSGDDELDELLRGYGYDPVIVEGDDPEPVHQRMAAALDTALDRIRRIQATCAIEGIPRTRSLADDRAAHAEGLDGAEGRRRRPHRGHVSRAPGAARRRCARSLHISRCSSGG